MNENKREHIHLGRTTSRMGWVIQIDNCDTKLIESLKFIFILENFLQQIW